MPPIPGADGPNVMSAEECYQRMEPMGQKVVLIGGGVSNAGEALIGPLNDYVRANRYGGHRAPTCPIRRAALGGDAGIIGAAYLDFEV